MPLMAGGWKSNPYKIGIFMKYYEITGYLNELSEFHTVHSAWDLRLFGQCKLITGKAQVKGGELFRIRISSDYL